MQIAEMTKAPYGALNSALADLSSSLPCWLHWADLCVVSNA